MLLFFSVRQAAPPAASPLAQARQVLWAATDVFTSVEPAENAIFCQMRAQGAREPGKRAQRAGKELLAARARSGKCRKHGLLPSVGRSGGIGCPDSCGSGSPKALAPVNPCLERGWQGIKIDGRSQEHQRRFRKTREQPLRFVPPGEGTGVRRLGASGASCARLDGMRAQRHAGSRAAALLEAGGKRLGQQVRNPVRMRTAHEDERRSHSSNSPQKGLWRRSSPMVVAGPWPGYTVTSSGRRNRVSRMERSNWSWLPPGKSVLPMER